MKFMSAVFGKSSKRYQRQVLDAQKIAKKKLRPTEQGLYDSAVVDDIMNEGLDLESDNSDGSSSGEDDGDDGLDEVKDQGCDDDQNYEDDDDDGDDGGDDDPEEEDEDPHTDGEVTFSLCHQLYNIINTKLLRYCYDFVTKFVTTFFTKL